MQISSFVVGFILLWGCVASGDHFESIPVAQEDEIDALYQSTANKRGLTSNVWEQQADIDDDSDDDDEIDMLDFRAIKEGDTIDGDVHDIEERGRERSRKSKPPAPPKKPKPESKFKGKADDMMPKSRGRDLKRQLRMKRGLRLKDHNKRNKKDKNGKKEKQGKRQDDSWPKTLGVNMDLMKDSPRGLRPGQSTKTNTCNKVRPIPSAIRALKFAKDGINKKYVKYTETFGIPIIGSKDVTDEGLKRACYALRFLLVSRFDVRNALYKMFAYFALIADNEQQTDLFEYSTWNSTYWDKRARGLGPTFSIPLTSAGDDNQRCKPGNRYYDQDILMHEAAHAYHKMGATLVIEGFEIRLKKIYKEMVINKKKWEDTYAATNPNEYLAVTTQLYMGGFIAPSKYISLYGVSDRKTLRAYDPKITALLDELYPCVANNDNKFINRCDWRLNPGVACGIKDYELKYSTLFRARSGCPKLAEKKSTLEACAITACFYGANVFNWNNNECIVVKCKGMAYAEIDIQTSNGTYNIYTAKSTMKKLEMTLEKEEAQKLSMDCMRGPEGTSDCENVVDRKQCGATDVNKNECTNMGCCWSNNKCFYSKIECKDSSVYCFEWAEKGECSRNPGFMYRKCQVACSICAKVSRLDMTKLQAMCQDNNEYCGEWAKKGECQSNPNWMKKNCKLSCKVCSKVTDPLGK